MKEIIIKIKAIWNLIRSEHYLVLTKYNMISNYPKIHECLNMIKSMNEQSEVNSKGA